MWNQEDVIYSECLKSRVVPSKIFISNCNNNFSIDK